MIRKPKTSILAKSIALAAAGIFLFSSVSFALRPQSAIDRIPAAKAPHILTKADLRDIRGITDEQKNRIVRSQEINDFLVRTASDGDPESPEAVGDLEHLLISERIISDVSIVPDTIAAQLLVIAELKILAVAPAAAVPGPTISEKMARQLLAPILADIAKVMTNDARDPETGTMKSGVMLKIPYVQQVLVELRRNIISPEAARPRLESAGVKSPDAWITQVINTGPVSMAADFNRPMGRTPAPSGDLRKKIEALKKIESRMRAILEGMVSARSQPTEADIASRNHYLYMDLYNAWTQLCGELNKYGIQPSLRPPNPNEDARLKRILLDTDVDELFRDDNTYLNISAQSFQRAVRTVLGLIREQIIAASYELTLGLTGTGMGSIQPAGSGVAKAPIVPTIEKAKSDLRRLQKEVKEYATHKKRIRYDNIILLWSVWKRQYWDTIIKSLSEAGVTVDASITEQVNQILEGIHKTGAALRDSRIRMAVYSVELEGLCAQLNTILASMIESIDALGAGNAPKVIGLSAQASGNIEEERAGRALSEAEQLHAQAESSAAEMVRVQEDRQAYRQLNSIRSRYSVWHETWVKASQFVKKEGGRRKIVPTHPDKTPALKSTGDLSVAQRRELDSCVATLLSALREMQTALQQMAASGVITEMLDDAIRYETRALSQTAAEKLIRAQLDLIDNRFQAGRFRDIARSLLIKLRQSRMVYGSPEANAVMEFFEKSGMGHADADKCVKKATELLAMAADGSGQTAPARIPEPVILTEKDIPPGSKTRLYLNLKQISMLLENSVVQNALWGYVVNQHSLMAQIAQEPVTRYAIVGAIEELGISIWRTHIYDEIAAELMTLAVQKAAAQWAAAAATRPAPTPLKALLSAI